MARRKSPLFIGALTLCGVLALGEAALIYERWAALRSAQKKLSERQNELANMASVMPPPSRKIAAEIEEDLARAQAALASMRAELKGRGAIVEKLRTAKAPAARTDAYFDLATYVEKMREVARKNDVAIHLEASRFGFAAYANEGPENDRIEPVFRQRQVIQYLTEALLEAKPTALLAIKREPTLSKAERQARDEALAAAMANAQPGVPLDLSGVPEIAMPDGPDYFKINPQASVKKPGFIETEAYRFIFSGQTAALRTFLNRLAAFEIPVLVREVEVVPAANDEINVERAPAEEQPAEEPAAGEGAASIVLAPKAAKAPAAKAPRGQTAAPIVTRPISKFTVTVEFVHLVTPAAPAAEGEQPTTPPQS